MKRKLEKDREPDMSAHPGSNPGKILKLYKKDPQLVDADQKRILYLHLKSKHGKLAGDELGFMQAYQQEIFKSRRRALFVLGGGGLALGAYWVVPKVFTGVSLLLDKDRNQLEDLKKIIIKIAEEHYAKQRVVGSDEASQAACDLAMQIQRAMLAEGIQIDGLTDVRAQNQASQGDPIEYSFRFSEKLSEFFLAKGYFFHIGVKSIGPNQLHIVIELRKINRIAQIDLSNYFSNRNSELEGVNTGSAAVIFTGHQLVKINYGINFGKVKGSKIIINEEEARKTDDPEAEIDGFIANEVGNLLFDKVIPVECQLKKSLYREKEYNLHDFGEAFSELSALIHTKKFPLDRFIGILTDPRLMQKYPLAFDFFFHESADYLNAHLGELGQFITITETPACIDTAQELVYVVKTLAERQSPLLTGMLLYLEDRFFTFLPKIKQKQENK